MISKKNTKTVSLADAQQAGDKYTQASSELGKVEVEMNKKINEVKARYTDRIAEATTKKEEAEAVLENYANANWKNWDGKKSFDLLHCTIGFRNSPPKVEKPEKSKWDAITGLVKKFFPNLVKEETVVSIDKKAVVAASKDEKLYKKLTDKTGITVVQDETFYVQAKEVELVS